MKDKIEERIKYILQHPPTWTDGNPKTQVERIMEVVEEALLSHEEKVMERVISNLKAVSWHSDSGVQKGWDKAIEYLTLPITEESI